MSDTIVSRVNRGWIGKAGVLAMGLCDFSSRDANGKMSTRSSRLGARAGRDPAGFAAIRIYGIVGPGYSRSILRRCSATRSGTTSRASRPRWSPRTAGRPRPSRVRRSTRRRSSPSRRVDELCRRTPSSDHPGSIRAGARTTAPHSSPLAAPSRIRSRTNFHCFPRDYPIQPRFRTLGADEVSGGCVRVDAARGSERKGTRSPSNRRDARRGF